METSLETLVNSGLPARSQAVPALGRQSPRALERRGDLMQAHHVRHLLDLLLLLVGEAREQRRGGPVEALNRFVVDVDLAVVALVRLEHLAERAQLGGNR